MIIIDTSYYRLLWYHDLSIHRWGQWGVQQEMPYQPILNSYSLLLNIIQPLFPIIHQHGLVKFLQEPLLDLSLLSITYEASPTMPNIAPRAGAGRRRGAVRSAVKSMARGASWGDHHRLGTATARRNMASSHRYVNMPTVGRTVGSCMGWISNLSLEVSSDLI